MTRIAAIRVGNEETAPKTALEPLAAGEAKVDPVMRAEIAAYISQMAAELGSMARAAKLDVLAYFLDMARIEANVQRQS